MRLRRLLLSTVDLRAMTHYQAYYQTSGLAFVPVTAQNSGVTTTHH